MTDEVQEAKAQEKLNQVGGSVLTLKPEGLVTPVTLG